MSWIINKNRCTHKGFPDDLEVQKYSHEDIWECPDCRQQFKVYDYEYDSLNYKKHKQLFEWEYSWEKGSVESV